jgi:hypothetical protein
MTLHPTHTIMPYLLLAELGAVLWLPCSCRGAHHP